MTPDDLYITYRDIDKEAMLHVEGRQPKLVRMDWQWKTVTLNSERNNITKA